MKLDNAFGIHEQALKLRSRRAELLASNMANADTPGFKARDIDFKQALKGEVVKQAQIKTTHKKPYIKCNKWAISCASTLSYTNSTITGWQYS